MISKEYNNLNNSKVSYLGTRGNIIPSKNIGKDGDISTVMINGVPILFVKVNGNWYASDLKSVSSVVLDINNTNSTRGKLGAPDYDSGWIQVPAETTSLGATENVVTVKHNLNCKMVVPQTYIRGKATDDGDENDIWSINASNTDHTTGTSAAADDSGVFVRLVDANTVDISFGNDSIFHHDNYYSTRPQDGDISEGYIRVLIWKAGVRQ